MVKVWRLYRNQLIYFSVNSQVSVTEIGLEWVSPFLAKVAILHPLKTPGNQRFSGVFRGYKIGTLAGNELIYFCDRTFINCCYSCITFVLNERSQDIFVFTGAKFCFVCRNNAAFVQTCEHLFG